MVSRLTSLLALQQTTWLPELSMTKSARLAKERT